jgi:hypothetical protein
MKNINLLIRKQNDVVENLVERYETKLQHQNSVIEYQSEIIQKQNDYISSLLAKSEKQSKRTYTLKFSLSRLFSFIF